MYMHRLYIGCGGQSEEAIDALDAYAASLRDYTSYRAYGSWRGQVEPTLVYEYVSNLAGLSWATTVLAERAKADLNQEAVLHVRWPVTAEIL
jgi:hypothetical protein